jgi:hypothetical protein
MWSGTRSQFLQDKINFKNLIYILFNERVSFYFILAYIVLNELGMTFLLLIIINYLNSNHVLFVYKKSCNNFV